MSLRLIVAVAALAFAPLRQDPPAPDWTLLNRQLPLLASIDPEDRLAARTVLQAPGVSTEVLVHFLADSSHAKTCAVALCVRGSDAGVEAVQKLAAGSVTADKILAIEAMRGFAPDLPALLKLLESEDFTLALAAARALGTWSREEKVVEAISAFEERSAGVYRKDRVPSRRWMLADLLTDAPNALSRFSYHANFLEDDAFATDFILVAFQYDIPVAHAGIADALRELLKRNDLPAASLEMAALAVLRSSGVTLDDIVHLWPWKYPKVQALARKRFESLGLQPERIDDWCRLLQAGGLPKEVERRVLEWLGTITGIKAGKTRAKDAAAWKGWYESHKKGLRDGKVDAAIDRGLAWLKPHALTGEHRDRRGLNALECYAMVKCGVLPGDPVLDRKLEAIRRSSPGETYDAALRVMLLAELLPQEAPVASGKTMTADEDGDPDRKALKAAVSWLLRAQRRCGAWSYDFLSTSDQREEERWDHSNTQFALLGLRAAANAGVEIPAEVWKRAEKHLVDTLQKGEEGPAQPEGGVITGPPEKGWGYGEHRDPDPPYWNMTCGGVTALMVCRASLSGKAPPDLQRDPDISAAFQWLSRRYMLAPKRPIESLQDLDLYALWSMERACLTAGRNELDRHDWYAEGSELLLRFQRTDGSWTGGSIHINAGPDYDSVPTCLALLFLRRAYVPVVTRSARWTPTPAPEK